MKNLFPACGDFRLRMTPSFSIENAIISANTFAEYLHNHIIHDIRDIDFKDFDDIIENNLGVDISCYVSDLTLDRFAYKGAPK